MLKLEDVAVRCAPSNPLLRKPWWRPVRFSTCRDRGSEIVGYVERKGVKAGERRPKVS
ncbi:MAG: hypothetical protein KatS3mg112_0949 [Thermogutta sp.]|nr:MAG: hypothetical protein KatS3mg112_0949 [Thermogutta sp.]